MCSTAYVRVVLMCSLVYVLGAIVAIWKTLIHINDLKKIDPATSAPGLR